ncbi:hypothetical protein GCM10009555_073430 [Acrocarpospora macrocephala]|uniref:DUF4396 domain-containing protein n=1 Tax=Acrocarpospora macrocephala TaxID=150177 RepID=A0A5M3X9W3_9ACTN|nr:DUF4396 domain-containing protein [Acrocarpospora macrocephala]GES16291.1 hypothetical protein Amac_098890 [Acrocarpospora macrocephala]
MEDGRPILFRPKPLASMLAFFGYALTLLALESDTLSILVMEIVDNTVMLAVPGAMDAGLTTALFWGTLIGSLAVAFVVTTPINKWIIGRGRGHAVLHSYHH